MYTYTQFCVIDDVIPKGEVESVCDEVRAAPGKAGANREAINDSDGTEGILRTVRTQATATFPAISRSFLTDRLGL